VVVSGSDGYEAFESAILGKGLLFMAAVGLQRSFNQPGIWCRQHGARQWSAREVSVEEKDGGVASRRRTVVTLMMIRFNGLRN
jgi:hypothetical protein